MKDYDNGIEGRKFSRSFNLKNEIYPAKSIGNKPYAGKFSRWIKFSGLLLTMLCFCQFLMITTDWQKVKQL